MYKKEFLKKKYKTKNTYHHLVVYGFRVIRELWAKGIPIITDHIIFKNVKKQTLITKKSIKRKNKYKFSYYNIIFDPLEVPMSKNFGVPFAIRRYRLKKEDIENLVEKINRPNPKNQNNES